MTKIRLKPWWVLCAVASLAACDSANLANPASPTRETAPSADVRGGVGASNADDKSAEDGEQLAGGVEKVDICHRPPGNPANAHPITVGAPALPAHLAHGDNVGACEGGGGG